MSKQAKTAANLSGATVVSVGLLVWNEKEDDEGGSTTWVTKKAFKEAVQAAGGKVGTAVNSRTTIVVKGNTTRGDGYATPLTAIALQQQAGSRKAGALKVESLASFVKEYPALKEALRRRLSSAYWPKTISVYDKHAQGVEPFTGKPRPPNVSKRRCPGHFCLRTHADACVIARGGRAHRPAAGPGGRAHQHENHVWRL